MITSMYKVTLNAIEQTNDNSCRRNWPLRVTVEALTEDADPNVFVYHAGEDGATGLEGGATFSNVASKQDMNVIPVDAPMAVADPIQAKDAYIPFFRKNTVELDCYNLIELNRLWDIIQHDISTLVKEYDAWNNLNKGNQIVVEI